MRTSALGLTALLIVLMASACKPAPTKHVVMHDGKTLVFEITDPKQLENEFARAPSELTAIKLWAYYSSNGETKAAEAWFAQAENLKVNLQSQP